MIDRTDPTNRDTVPAMLTPGEFVLNKEASNMFAPVIEQMNNAGLQQRAMENNAMVANMGGGVPPQNYNLGGEAGSTQGIKSLLNFIGSGEGGYEASNRGTVDKKIVGSTNNTVYKGKKLSEMTINEILEAQALTGDDRLFAVGKYQMIPSTFKEVVEGMGLSGDTVFSPDFQDQAGMYLATQKRPILGAYLNGQDWNGKAVDEDTALMELAKEWASAPLPYDVQIGNTLRKAGDSRYGAGNKAQHSIQEARDAIRSAKIGMTGEYPDNPQNYGEYSPDRFLREAQTINNPGSTPPQIMDNNLRVDNSISGVIPEVITSTFLPEQQNVPELRAAPPQPQSFGEAFAAGRSAHGGGGGMFDYNGQKYSTNIAEEDQMATANNGGLIQGLNNGGLPNDEEMLSGSSQAEVERFLGSQVNNQERGIPGGSIPRPTIERDDLGNIIQGNTRATTVGGEPFFMYDDGVVTDKDNMMVMTDGLIKKVHEKLTFSPQQMAADNQLQEESEALREHFNGVPELGDGVNPSFNEMTVPQDTANIIPQLSQDDAKIEAARVRHNAEVEARSQEVPPPLDLNAPTFNKDVIPYLGRVSKSLITNAADTVKDFAAKGVVPVGTVDVNKEYRDLKALIAKGSDVDGNPLTENQIRAYNLRIKSIERDRDYSKKMEPFSSSNVLGNVLESGDKLASGVDNLVTNAAGDIVSRFDPELGVSILDSSSEFIPSEPRPLTADEIEFNSLRSGATVPEVGGSRPMSLTPESRSVLNNQTRMQQAQTTVNKLEKPDPKVTTAPAAEIAAAELEAKRVAETQSTKVVTTEVKGAMSILKDVFGDIFDKKELVRAAVLYLGGRATGLNGNQALAFAGKNYIARVDANENTYKKIALAGLHTPETVAAYKKSKDPNVLTLKSTPLIDTGVVEVRYNTVTGKKYTVSKMQNPVTKGMTWVMPDGKTPVDYKLTTTDPRYASGTPENDSYLKDLSDQFTKSVKEFEELDANRTSGENKNERKKLIQIGPSAFGDAATEYMINNGVSEQAMTGILANVYDEMVADVKSEKVKNLSRSSIDGYFQRSWVEVATKNATVFMLADQKTPVPTANVKVFFDTVKRVGGDQGISILNDTQFSQFLLNDPVYSEWVALDEDVKKKYNDMGVDGPTSQHKSGFMEYVLKSLLL